MNPLHPFRRAVAPATRLPIPYHATNSGAEPIRAHSVINPATGGVCAGATGAGLSTTGTCRVA